MSTRYSVLSILLSWILSTPWLIAQDTEQRTYCNPLNLDYTYMIFDAHKELSYRSGADPAVIEFRGEYYLFVTRSMGYWHSKDLLNWEFIKPQQWFFMGSNAPAAFNYKDSLVYVVADPSGSNSVLYTDNPKNGEWNATPALLHQLQDPNLFIDIDENGEEQAYIFWGSSNKFPIRGRKLDMDKLFRPSDEIVELFNLQPEKHGWERFGENHMDTVLGGYIEGPWLTKHNGKYYMEYAAPGTEWNVYGDGVYMSDHPLGPYTYAAHNPFSYKPGGYMNGAGHGSTVLGPQNTYWHFTTAAIAVSIGWERRIVMYPTYFDEDGLMHSETSFGDYPHYAPTVPGKQGQFTGWMLLSYAKPVKASSSMSEYGVELINDENVKTFWVAADNDDKQWVEIDLEAPADVYATQVNYHDYQSGIYGRVPGLYHRYKILGSLDGTEWFTLVDRSDSYFDVPNDYVQLGKPQKARYIRYQNIHVPTPYLSISDLRIFGIGEGEKPDPVQNFEAVRGEDRREAHLSWSPVAGAQGYNIRWGIAPDKLYSSWLVYDDTSLQIRSLNIDQEYYFTIEAFNENGISSTD